MMMQASEERFGNDAANGLDGVRNQSIACSATKSLFDLNGEANRIRAIIAAGVAFRPCNQ
jgi:hypothetical protein